MGDLTDRKIWNELWNAKSLNFSSFSISSRDRQQWLSEILSDAPLNGRLLELGGAPGTVAKMIHKLRPDLEISCIDFSEVGVAETRKLYETEGIRGEVYCEDFRYFSAEKDFDVVVSFGLIEHFEDYSAIIKDHLKIVKKGGSVIISIPNYSQWPVYIFLKFFSKKTCETHNFDCMSLDELVKDLDQCSEKIYSGKFGASTLPHTHYDSSLGGLLYHYFARVWNGTITLLSHATKNSLHFGQWRSNLYIKIIK
jgi:2-polyprenyl-3-methyl-5-hydroxy-6-metoxy-1,4-benzoquinol methylase